MPKNFNVLKFEVSSINIVVYYLKCQNWINLVLKTS